MTERIARFEHDGREGYGALAGDDTLDLLEGPGYDGLRRTGEQVALADVRLLAPVADPRLIGVGLNYAEHAAESGLPEPDQPMLFHLPSTAVCNPGDDIVYPRQGRVVHYEGELAVVIGAPARRVSAERALDHVLRLHHRQRRERARHPEGGDGQRLPAHRQGLRHLQAPGPLDRHRPRPLGPAADDAPQRAGRAVHVDGGPDLHRGRADRVPQRRRHPPPRRRDHDRHPLRRRRGAARRRGGDRDRGHRVLRNPVAAEDAA